MAREKYDQALAREHKVLDEAIERSCKNNVEVGAAQREHGIEQSSLRPYLWPRNRECNGIRHMVTW